ncbi:hypothetical protein HanHA300_Chr11g0398981 [Helianthus annuus]|nr:hypothetical protein HanHA300_Chr11g0398981 [Helianthus annuus]KAJ0685185.1 hypothetical protein HanLR1_Chr11g0399721 [Helianthus annuus]
MENQDEKKVKEISCDNGTKFKTQILTHSVLRKESTDSLVLLGLLNITEPMKEEIELLLKLHTPCLLAPNGLCFSVLKR